ncbi:MAG: potassium transporter Kup [Stygiobacter sp. RIFOXYC12_FULL_38_8]|nr:MAG: potassium transporter Kup [Stygiobacter sp. GWC2_38_9]OGU85117.1 MAG: potassium transporter Kup [Stygiobacter sp. RIFOXYA12_FULL_38_9]OGV08555.1 MAG: potassium transporter Kup [Stygiobacter sp. RIFOXYB2_FULL_37_11]OGV10005.1 MAG: potassium transporter Kup [Stygiobacter sp. RIFOXYA2_FULL_38_8]OGV12558.1 MAG: potassium transporter Kup [Stygiobacter sp. RIFOXYC2_FULL_38_25]OGV30028.1 MAG: potassium transporter Kup [Stygiobacter sp. RIFOXYC12_FULL_38_8]OGV78823.1 MAG: potassium transporte
MAHKKSDHTNFREILKAMGLVFGDIGTSPIYTLSVIFLLTAPTQENVLGILSLMFWTLIILVTIEYTFLAMHLDSKGEGGIVVLKEILHSNLKKGKSIAFVTFMGYVGVSLLMGDGVITPAISILSAVEGLQLIPGMGHIGVDTIVIITIVITVLLFAIQSKGTDKVAASFGPIMVIWFSALFISGFFSMMHNPMVVFSLSPHYGIQFLINNGAAGFIVLSEVILCATGGEALYADMGHLGKKPIRHAWIFVFIALLMNYLGQGSYVVSQGTDYDPKTNILFSMVKGQVEFLYVPFLILTLLATIIASQAMISAVFSLVYQGIRTHIFPLTRVKYTSTHLKSQIYIDSVNWLLLISVILIILVFKASHNLAAAYGFAVTATMAVSTVFMLWIYTKQKSRIKVVIASLVFIVNVAFLVSVFTKIPHGGYWSIIIAAVPFAIIYVWTKGNRAIYRSFRSLPIDTYLVSYEQIYEAGKILPGTALFFTKSLDMIPPYMVHCTLRGGILYEDNVLVSVVTTDSPRGIQKLYVPEIADGLSGFEIQIGYMERLDIPKLLKETDIDPKVMFYGVDDIKAKKMYLKFFSFIKRITPNFVQFIELPYHKLHGVLTRIEI